MVDLSNVFSIKYTGYACIDCISEDAIRQLVEGLEVTFTDKSITGLVQSTSGMDVKYIWDNGNFGGVQAKVNGKLVTLFPGVGGGELHTFIGSPSESYPGPGWDHSSSEVVALTESILNQPAGTPSSWKIFYAKRATVINSF